MKTTRSLSLISNTFSGMCLSANCSLRLVSRWERSFSVPTWSQSRCQDFLQKYLRICNLVGCFPDAIGGICYDTIQPGSISPRWSTEVRIWRQCTSSRHRASLLTIEDIFTLSLLQQPQGTWNVGHDQFFKSNVKRPWGEAILLKISCHALINSSNLQAGLISSLALSIFA